MLTDPNEIQKRIDIKTSEVEAAKIVLGKEVQELEKDLMRYKDMIFRLREIHAGSPHLLDAATLLKAEKDYEKMVDRYNEIKEKYADLLK